MRPPSKLSSDTDDTNNTDEFDASKFTIEDRTHWIEAHLNDGLDVHEPDLLAFRTALIALQGWEKKPVLIHMGAMTGVSLTVRNRLGQYTHPTPVAVLGATLMDEVIAAFFLRSPTHTKYFTSYNQALHWLRTHPPLTPLAFKGTAVSGPAEPATAPPPE